MPLPSITVTVAPSPVTAVSPLRDEVVGIVGPTGTGSSAAVGTLESGDQLSDFPSGDVGTGETYNAISQLLGQVEVETVWSPTVAAPSEAQFATAVDLLATYRNPVSMVLPIGALGYAAANLTKLQTFCADGTHLARAVVNANQTGGNLADRAAAAVTSAAGLGNRIWMIYNKRANSYLNGAYMGAVLALAATRGRGWGIQMAPVAGAGVLQDHLNLGATALTALDDAGISSLITAEGATRIAGGFFNYPAGDPQRDWSVARVIDHVEHIIRRTWLRALVGSTLSLAEESSVLQASVDPLVGSEVVDVSVTGISVNGANRTFGVVVELVTPAGNINVELTIET